MASDETLNIHLPAKKATAMSACGQLIVERSQAAWHRAIKFLRERTRAETQHRRNSRLHDERGILIGSKWRLFRGEGRIDPRYCGDRADYAQTAKRPGAAFFERHEGARLASASGINKAPQCGKKIAHG
jgi:hypothetical protein